MVKWEVKQGDCIELLKAMPSESVQCCVTSPPYWGLRDYGVEGQIGLEASPEMYVEKMVDVFREVRRVLREDGTLWLNLGDSYYGSWQNYGGGNRGAGKQRPIIKGSAAQNPVWEGLEDARPAATQPHPTLKPKDLVGIPWRVALALQADGWWLRCDIIWSKPNPMPESVTDRPTKAHEYIFLMTKSERYFYDSEAIKEPCESGPSDIKKMTEGMERIGGKYKILDDPLSKASSKTNIGQKRSVGSPDGRNRRSVWTVGTHPFPGAHFATFPPKLIEPCILAGSKEGDTILDPFCGSGTVGMVALRHGRKFIGLELNEKYCEMARDRIVNDAPLLNGRNGQ